MKIPAPGSKNGPCKECGHIKCVEMRRRAKTICPICQRPIGYENEFVEYEERLFHKNCKSIKATA